jgi:hypothetical protein
VGQKIRIPFQSLLIVATNLSESADPAFLRRIGIEFTWINLMKNDMQRSSGVMARPTCPCREPGNRVVAEELQERKSSAARLRASRSARACRDICKLLQQRFIVSEELLEEARLAYFGATK